MEGFNYGKLVNKWCKNRWEEVKEEGEKKKEEISKVKPSGDREGGYVVYRQTVELANLLDKKVDV